jgi:hypothetical protein
MRATPGMYAVQATITRTTPDGWQSSVQTPTFFLHADVQGITSVTGAESIARRMVTEIAGPGAEVHVTVADVTGDHAYPAPMQA